MSEKIPVNPDILKWARQTAGMQLSEVAHKMGKDVETISLWERGESTPTYIQLEKLAYKIYKRPIALFFFPEPPKEETPGQAFRTIPEHEIEKMSSRMHYLLKQARAMQINLAELNDNVNPAKYNIVHDLKFQPGTSSQTMAVQVREYLGIDLETQFSWKDMDYAFKAWRNALENHGVFVFKEAFKDDSLSGFCLHHQQFPLIYVNNSTPKSRQIFSIFHELAHLLLGTGGVDTRKDDYIDYLEGDDRKIEILCNCFAGAFLVPDSDFSQRIAKVTVSDLSIKDLAEKYNVSREVILRKFLDRRLISREYYSRKAGQWTDEAREARKKRKGSGGSYYANKGAYLGEGYLSLAFKKYFQKKISINQLADYLGVKVKSISDMESILLNEGGRA
jgi:Zn-dependent peptidase ImmA (M78 family)/DNA-binding transcriptional regulator YiaG